MRRFNGHPGDLKTETPLIVDLVQANGVPTNRRLGRIVKVPEEELAFVTEEALEEILEPEALNSGNVVDIYQHREEDFLTTSTLEVTYHDEKGQKVAETLFVDQLYPQSYPRICVSAQAVQAMHRAISVLTRKVDNLTMTLRTCREHYYKELFFLRHGRPPKEEHEVYWFSPKAYEDVVTKQIMRDRLFGREKELQEALDEKEKELDRLRLTLGGDDDVSGLRKVVANMPIARLFKFLKLHNNNRQAEFYSHMERELDLFRAGSTDRDNASDRASTASPGPGLAPGGLELVERLEAAEMQVAGLQNNVQNLSRRNSMLCKQVRTLGGIPGLVEPESIAREEEEAKKQAEKQAELEQLRREERLKMIEENDQARRDGREHAAKEMDALQQKVAEKTVLAEAWEADAKRLLTRLKASQQDLEQKEIDLRAANRTIEKLWMDTEQVKHKRKGRGGARALEDASPSPAGTPRAGTPRSGSKALTLPQEHVHRTHSGSRPPSSSSPARRGQSQRRAAVQDIPLPFGQISQALASGGGRGRAQYVAGQATCTCGAPVPRDMAFCPQCGARKDAPREGPLVRMSLRRSSSAPLELEWLLSGSGALGGRDSLWKEMEATAARIQRGLSQQGSARSQLSQEAEKRWEEVRNSGLADSISSFRESTGEATFGMASSGKVDAVCQTDDNLLRELAKGRRSSKATQEFSEYLVFNSGNRVDSRGLLYCSQKSRDFQRNILARWGTTVVGVDEGDGWVRVGDHFLPKNLDGKPVLIQQLQDEYTLCSQEAAGLPGPGLAFHGSKQFEGSPSDCIVPWGSAIVAADAGDGWIRVGERYLPKELNGVPVVELQATDSFLVFDGHPGLDSPGLPFCLRKRLDTATKSMVPWGEVVIGVDEGDGWVKVGQQYLPKDIEGEAVLLMQAPENFAVVSAPAGVETPGIPLCLEKKLSSQCGWSDWESAIRGCDHGDGWVKVGDLFVPTSLDGQRVLEHEASGNFLVTCVDPDAGSRGVPYCTGKSLADDIGVSASWDTVVHGVDERDGWVKVGDFYLPKELEGVPVLKREETCDYTVCSGHPEVQTLGLPYCLSKDLHQRYGKVATWRASIRGSDEGDGWVKVGESYLPDTVDGKRILKPQERQDFVVCDGHPAFGTPGLPFCAHHDLTTGCGIIAPWGSTVQGVDEGNGWIRCGASYLPKTVDGMPVLRPRAQTIYTVCDGHPKIHAEGLPYYLQKREASKSFVRLAPWGSTVTGWDEGDGWVKVGNRYLPKEVDGIPVLSLSSSDDPDLQVHEVAELRQSPASHRHAARDPESEPEPDDGGQRPLSRPFSSAAEYSGASEYDARRPSTVEEGMVEEAMYCTVDGVDYAFPLARERSQSPFVQSPQTSPSPRKGGRGAGRSSSRAGAGRSSSPRGMPGASPDSAGVMSASDPVRSPTSQLLPSQAHSLTGSPSPYDQLQDFSGGQKPQPHAEDSSGGQGWNGPQVVHTVSLPDALREAFNSEASQSGQRPSRRGSWQDSRQGSKQQSQSRRSSKPQSTESSVQLSVETVPAGPRLELGPETAAQDSPTQTLAGHQQMPWKSTKISGAARSMTPATRTPTPATWLPSVGESRAGSSMMGTRPGSILGTRPRMVNSEVQTIVGFDFRLPGWSLAVPHPSMKKDKPEAYQLGVYMRYHLMRWCINFIAVLDPGLLSSDLIEAAMQHVQDGCKEVTAGHKIGDEFVKCITTHMASSQAVQQARANAGLIKPKAPRAAGFRGPSPRTGSKGASDRPGLARPPARAPSKNAPQNAKDLPAISATGLHSKEDQFGVRQALLNGNTKDAAVQADVGGEGLAFAGDVPPGVLKNLRKSWAYAMGVRKPPPAAVGRRANAVSRGTFCPTCGRPGWVSSSPSAGARLAGKQGLDSSEDSPSSPSKTSQDLKPRKPRLPVTETERRRSLQQRHSVVLQEIKDIAEKADKGIGGDDTGPSSASEAGGIFSEAEAKEFSDVDEIEGSTKEAVFAPLKLTELVNSGWPGFFHEGGGTFITAQSARDKKLLKRYWRHEVATGGVSNRDAETIVRGRRDSAVETPPLQGPDVEDMEISGTSAPSRPSQEREPREPKEPADAAAKSARRARVVAPTDGPSGTR